MDDYFALVPLFMQMAAAQQLRKCNSLTERYGLSLSEEQIQNIIIHRRDALRNTGRVEFGEGITQKLIMTFCDSPYLMQDNYEEAITQLQDLFYIFKNESEDTISDDDLIMFMKKTFDGKAQGSLMYLSDLTLDDLFGEHEHEPDEEDSDCDSQY